MADYYQVKNQNIFNPPANTSLGNATNQFNNVYVENDLVLGNVTVTGETIVTPKVSTITYPGDDTAADPAGGQTITLTGSGFNVGATVLINNVEVSVVSVVSSTTITFTSPANSTGSYVLYVINTDGGTAIAIPGIQYSGTPTWTTAAGSLGSVYETANFNSTVTATGDAPITYSVANGTLPPGATFNSNGTITGTSELLSSPTTYTFTVTATDAELQDTNRTFSLTINPDVVTWVSPANGTSYSSAVNSAISNVTLSATSAVGSGITYTANALPTGLSLTGATISGTPTVIADSSTLLTATANTTSSNASITINWVINVANDPYFEYNTLLIPGASTTFVDDASTNNFAVTINGDTKPNNFNPYTPGYYSNYFDGSTSYFTATTGTAFPIGTEDFTVEMWLYKLNSWTNNNQVLLISSTSGSLQIWVDSGLGLLKVTYNSVSEAVSYSTSTLKTGTWYHFAVTRSGNNFTIYINGASVATGTNSASFATPTSIRIGNFTSGTSDVWNGYISNLRIVRGSVIVPPAGGPTSPVTAVSGTSLLICQSNRFIDTSTNAFTLTAVGSPQVSGFDPFVPNSSYATYGSAYFDGTGDYLSVPDNVALQFGTGNFTIEMWVYLNTVSGVHGFLSKGLNSVGWSIVQNGTTLYFEYGATNITSSTTLVANKWTHIAVVRSGTGASQTVIYVDGVSAGTGAVSTNFNDTNALVIGEYRQAGYTINAYVTDVRVVKGTAVYTTAFTPPASPLTAVSGTSLLTLQNNQSATNSVFLDNSSNNLAVTRNGNTTQGTFSPYGGNWSNYFDGSGDNLGVNYASGSTLAGNFTIESWVYDTGSTAYGTVLGWRNGTSGWSGLLIQRNGGNNLSVPFNNNAASITQTSGTYLYNQWNHVAVVRVGTTVTLYVNGTSAGTTTVSGSFNPGSNYCAGTDPFNDVSTVQLRGYISNQRVVNGTAIYTGNFTPPTAPLTPVTGTGLLICQSNTIKDNSINNFTVTTVGDVSVQRFSPFNPSSVTPTSYSGYFGTANGNSLYLSAQSSGTGGIALSGNYTIEMWLYPTAASGSGYSMLVATNTEGGVMQYYYNSSGNLGYYSPVAGQLTTSSAPLTFNAWQHVALVRSSNVVKVYVNGVEKAFSSTITDSSTVYANYIGGLGTVYNTFGYISNLRVNNTALYTSTFTPPTSPLTAISGTQLLTCQSSTFIDNSTNNYAITSAGSPRPSIQNPFGFTSTTTEGYSVNTIGGSAYFDGNGDYLNVGNSASLSMTGSNFTAEAWVYFTALPAFHAETIVQKSGKANVSVPNWSIGTVNGYWQYLIGQSGGPGTALLNVQTSSTMTVGVWYHVALVKTGTSYSLYLNGININTSTTASVPADNNSLPCTIGYQTDQGSSSYLNGYISDVRIVNGTAVYTSNFIPPTAPLTAVQNTTLLTNMTSAGIYDASMMNDMETVGDAKLSTAVTKFGGSSMYFDGSGDYLSANPTGAGDLGTGDFTIEYWMNASAAGSYSGPAGTQEVSGFATAGMWRCLNRFNSANGIYFAYTTGSTFVDITFTSTNYNDGAWHHIAYVKSGTSLKAYVDGTQVGTSATLTQSLTSGKRLTLGYNPQDNAYYTGYLDDIRITKGYARYTSNFTPPTSAFPLY